MDEIDRDFEQFARHADPGRVATGQAIRRPFGALGAVAIAERELATLSPDGSRLFAATGDGTIRLHDAANGNLISAPIHHAGLRSLRLSPTGDVLVTTGEWLADGGAVVLEPAEALTLKLGAEEHRLELTVK